MKGELGTVVARPQFDLELCPWCGGPAAFECLENGRFSVGCNDSVGKHAECLGFQLMTTFATKREACIAWNTRAPSDLTAQLDKAREALDQANKDGFTSGYLIAVANIVNLHGDDVIAKDVLRELGASASDIRRLDLTDYDAKPLRKLFSEIKRKDALPARACLPATSGDVG